SAPRRSQTGHARRSRRARRPSKVYPTNNEPAYTFWVAPHPGRDQRSPTRQRGCANTLADASGSATPMAQAPNPLPPIRLTAERADLIIRNGLTGVSRSGPGIMSTKSPVQRKREGIVKLADIKPHLRPYSIVQRRRTTINHAFASALAPCDEYVE